VIGIEIKALERLSCRGIFLFCRGKARGLMTYIVNCEEAIERFFAAEILHVRAS
jgi:hypothetical protein